MNRIWLKLKYLNRQRNFKVKILKNRLKFLLLKLLIKRKKTTFNANEYQNILIFMHTNGLGDAVVTSGFIHALKDHGKKVYIIAGRKISFLFEHLIPVDKIIEYDPKNNKALKEQTSRLQFDLIVDFSNMDNSFFKRLKTLSILNYKHAISFNQQNHNFYDTNIIDKDNKHISNRMIYVLSLLKIKCDSYHYHLVIPKNNEKNVDKFIHDFISKKKIIIFNPFASDNVRSMSIKQINQIIEFLEIVEDYNTVVFDMKKGINLSGYKNVVVSTFESFIDATELVKRSDLVLTVDTSIVHLAQAFDKRLIAIYNNKILQDHFINQIVWGPNYELATQIITEPVLTNRDDPIYNLDAQVIIEQLKTELNLL